MKLKFAKYEYTGRLISIDGYFNLQLANTQEHKEGDEGENEVTTLGDALIRYLDRQSLHSRWLTSFMKVEQCSVRLLQTRWNVDLQQIS